MIRPCQLALDEASISMKMAYRGDLTYPAGSREARGTRPPDPGASRASDPRRSPRRRGEAARHARAHVGQGTFVVSAATPPRPAPEPRVRTSINWTSLLSRSARIVAAE